jgi:uncharacterized protein
MDTSFPEFTYHPHPLETGSIILSSEACLVCGQKRGYIYTGPVYSEEELGSHICPWCIADGAAHTKFAASFVDEGAIGGYGAWVPVTQEIIQAVAYRTPCFAGWQQERWWTHCGDAAVFIGIVGYNELLQYGEQALAAIAEETGFTGEDLAMYMKALSKKGSPSAYLFQCRCCGAYGGYSDCD